MWCLATPFLHVVVAVVRVAYGHNLSLHAECQAFNLCYSEQANATRPVRSLAGVEFRTPCPHDSCHYNPSPPTPPPPCGLIMPNPPLLSSYHASCPYAPSPIPPPSNLLHQPQSTYLSASSYPFVSHTSSANPQVMHPVPTPPAMGTLMPPASRVLCLPTLSLLKTLSQCVL